MGFYKHILELINSQEDQRKNAIYVTKILNVISFVLYKLLTIQ